MAATAHKYQAVLPVSVVNVGQVVGRFLHVHAARQTKQPGKRSLTRYGPYRPAAAIGRGDIFIWSFFLDNDHFLMEDHFQMDDHFGTDNHFLLDDCFGIDDCFDERRSFSDGRSFSFG